MTVLPLARPARLGLLAVAACMAGLLAMLPGLAALDDRAHDQLIRFSPSQPAPPGVVLVDIDEQSLQAIGPWPWSREVLAALSRAIDQQGVRLQAWDLFLPEPSVGDAALKAQWSEARAPVVLGQVLVTDPAVSPAPAVGQRVAHAGVWPREACATDLAVLGHLGVSVSLANLAPVGHLTATPDGDGRLRRLPALLCDGANRYPQLALAAAAALPAAPGSSEFALAPASAWARIWGPHATLRVGGLDFPLNAQQRLFVPYARPHGQWPAVSAANLLAGGSQASLLRGQIVLVGSTALGAGDKVATPFHPSAPGLSVHAELMGAALSGQWRMPVGQPALVSAFMALVLALLWLPMTRRPRRGSALGLALGLVLVGPWVLAVLGLGLNRLLPIAAPTLGLAAAGLLLLLVQLDLQRRQARRLASHLESVLPAALAREIAHQDPSGESLGRPGEGLVLAVQIRGLERWTSVMDSLKALALIHALSAATDKTARSYGGSLEHRQGDLLLVVFPGPEAGRASVRPLLQSMHAALSPLLGVNESERCPLSLQFALEYGPYLLAVAGGPESRRPLLLGPVIDNVVGIAQLAPELAAQAILGPALAIQQPESDRATHLQLGSFLLPEQPEPKPLVGLAWAGHPAKA